MNTLARFTQSAAPLSPATSRSAEATTFTEPVRTWDAGLTAKQISALQARGITTDLVVASIVEDNTAIILVASKPGGKRVPERIIRLIPGPPLKLETLAKSRPSKALSVSYPPVAIRTGEQRRGGGSVNVDLLSQWYDHTPDKLLARLATYPKQLGQELIRHRSLFDTSLQLTGVASGATGLIAFDLSRTLPQATTSDEQMWSALGDADWTGHVWLWDRPTAAIQTEQPRIGLSSR